MKKAMILILILCMLLCCQTVFADETCGTNVKYTIEGDTITYSRNDAGEPNAVWGSNCRTPMMNDTSITKVIVSETIRVTNGVGMFRNLSAVREMDLSNLNVSAVTDMYEMFKDCGSLESLNIGNWTTSNVTDMYEMFSGCGSLQSLDIGNWVTSKVTYYAWDVFRLPAFEQPECEQLEHRQCDRYVRYVF